MQKSASSNSINLLIYSHYFPPSVGGVETITLALARGLAELRSRDAAEFSITVVTQTPQGNYDDVSLPFTVIRQPALSKLRKLVKECDLLHVAGPALAPLFWGLLSGKPIVLEHHGFQTICPNGQLLIEPTGIPCPGHFMAGNHRICWSCNSGSGWAASFKLWALTFVRRYLAKRVTVNITPTRWLGELVKLPNVVAIPHGIELIPIATAAAEKNVENPVIAFQGRLVTTKGVRLLFEAAQLLREQGRIFQMVIIGDGPERSFLEQFAREKNLEPHVTFMGRLSGEQLETTLRSAFALVVPSLGGEVFGLVLIENMQRSLPVIASDIGAFAEVLGDGGLTFRTGEAEDLAAKLASLLDDPGRAAQVARSGRQRMLDFFQRGRMIDMHASIYRGRTKIKS